MLPVTSSRDRCRAAKGSALIIVLFFIVLMTIVTVAFLSRSLTAVKVAAGSAGETKSKILASSASDIIIGDFKQEIIAGSGANSGTVNYPIYNPSTNLTMIPFMNGVPMAGTPSTNAIPNLICRSVSPANTTGSAPYVAYPNYYTSSLIPSNRAANDSSAATSTYTSSKVNSATPSINGRYVSAAQWNSHYLIPRDPSVDTPGSTTADSSPVPAFVPPDWVIVTRGGVNSVSATTPGLGTGGLADPTPTNVNYAVGRYAYAVYNEGGLLDMNAAGYPGTDAASGSTGLTAAQIGKKGSLALADLTQLAAGAVNLTQAQINNIVGWRNYASSEPPAPSGSFGSFAFSATSASNWLNNFVLNNTNGFMQIAPPASTVTTPPTDQAFLSRAQLISVTQSLGISPDFLQYMGTFSRALEQPSVNPDPNRPKILTTGGSPPAANSVDSYTGNNDQEGNDATTASNPINPAFLSLRVPSSAVFTRLNGAPAVPGEPLVKTKFPLSWLSLVTYSSTNSKVQSDPIYARFGIYRSGNTSPWVYDHGINGSSGQPIIGTLKQVAALGTREPDFAELLKAAIVAGSLGKAGPNLHGNQENYQYCLDAQVDFQVLQIMANLIDQQDSDSYPTCIQIYNPGQGAPVTVSGTEDLPYFYRFRFMSVVTRVPAPLLSRTATATFPAFMGTLTGSTPNATPYTGGGQTTKTWTITNPAVSTYTGCMKTSLSDQGEAAFLYVPDLWNPHDPNTPSTSSLRPTSFRICASTIDPISLLSTPWTIGVESIMGGSNLHGGALYELDTPGSPANYYWPISGGGATATVTPSPTTWPLPTSSGAPNANATLTFSDNGGKLFREPTALWNANPTNIAISGAHVLDANTGQTYYGIIAGKTPISMQATLTSTPAQSTDGTYVFQGNQLGITTLTPAAYPNGNNDNQITFLLQYLDPNGTGSWITYDVKYPEAQHSGMNNPSLIVNKADYTNGSWQSPLANSQISATGTVIDPRTARWGVGSASTLGNAGNNSHGNLASSNVPYVLEPYEYANFSTYGNLKSHYFNVFESNRPRVDPGNQTYYSNPCMTIDPNSTPPYTQGLRNAQMRFFSPGEFRAGSSAAPASPADFDGMFTQNNPAIKSGMLSQDGVTPDSIYSEDPDGVARLAMGGYADTTLAGSTVGLPEATASTMDDNATATATSQSQSRPIILNRAFRSVSEMSYAFRGSPWKNIDFFTPSSGDSALLDVFCVNPPPATSLVAGKVDLNTRNVPVLQAMVGRGYIDEVSNAAATPPGYALPPLSSMEAQNIASTLETITSDTAHTWRGPLQNVSELVGRYVTPPTSTTDTDFYSYSPPALSTGSTLPGVAYAGLSVALDCTSFNGAAHHVFSNASTPLIQRFRESAIRPFTDAGQVRVWNLLIDVVAQTGRYPKSATGLDQFFVDGQTHLWVHVAIDRLTGQVLDKQTEVVSQ
jgi:hypothetical protein